MHKKILIYSQDVGGAKFVAPVMNSILEKYNAMVVVHPLSESIFVKYNIPFSPLSHYFNDLPPTDIEIESFLISNKITHIFCTLSSPYLDLTNSNLIKISRKLNIPTFGIMDHWKGYDRFFDKNGKTSYMPDFIGCIDNFCKEELLKIFRDPDRIFIIGHPYLERILHGKKSLRKNINAINILIVSQPNTKDKSFHSIFLQRVNSGNLVEKIYKSVKKIDFGADIEVYYRPHPKEKPYSSLPEAINFNTEGWDEALLKYDIFIGLNSMLLVEAALAGKHCISLDIPEFSDFQGTLIPYKIWDSLENIDTLESALQKGIKKLKQYSPINFNLSLIDKQLSGSSERTVYYFEQFITSREKRYARKIV